MFFQFLNIEAKMSYIEATREINSLVNKIKYREKRIAQQYREIHDMVSELEEFMGNATELVFNNKLLLRRNENSEILPIEIDVFSEAITYCYHEIIEKQLESISQKKQRIRELKLEIEELVKVNEALRRNKKDLETQIQKSNLQENNTDKTRTCLIASITFAVLLVIALLLTATLRESAVVLLFLGLSTISFIWNSILVFEKQSLNNRKDDLTEKEFLFNKAIQSFENEKQLFEQEKIRLKGINETTIKTVNEKLQIARQQKEKYLAQEKEYQEKLAQLNEQFANLKEQIEAGEHAKRKAVNLELDYKRLFEKYHNRESDIQTLQSELNNSTDENKRLSNKIASLGAEIEKIQKQQEDSLKEKQELERKYKDLMSQEKSLENDNKVFQRQQEYYQNKYSELDIDFKRVEAENQELERKNQNLISQETSLLSKNKELQTQNNSFQTKISDLEKEIKRVREEKQGKENENAGLSSQISSLKVKNEELKAQSNSFQAKITDLEKEIKRVREETQGKENDNAGLSSQISSLKAMNEELKAQIVAFESNISDLKNEIKFHKNENQEWENKYQVSNSQINSLTTKNEDLEKQILNYRYEVIQLNIANQDIMKECESLRNEKRIRKDESNRKEFLDLQTKFNALQEEKQEQEDKYQKLKSQNTFLVDKNNKLQKQNSDYQYSIIELESEVQELKNNCLALEDENQDKKTIQKEYLDLQTRYKILQEDNVNLKYQLVKMDSAKAQLLIQKNLKEDSENELISIDDKKIPELSKNTSVNENSVQDLFFEIADEIIKKASYSKEELIALYRRFNMSIFSGNAKINNWTDDVFGDFLIIEENKRFVIDPEIAAKVRNREVENE